MMAVRIILLFLSVFILSYLTGAGIVRIQSGRTAELNDIFGKIAIGFAILGIFETVICFIAGLCNLPDIYVVVLTILFVLAWSAFAVIRKSREKGGKEQPENGRCESKDRRKALYFIAAALIVGLEAAVVILFQYDRFEAVKSISISTKTYMSGRCAGLNPIMNLWGCAAFVLKVHPLTLIYTILPAVLIPMYHLCCYVLLRTMFKGRYQKAFWGIVVFALMQVWGYQSDTLIPLTMLFEWFGMPCLTLYGIIPGLVTAGSILWPEKSAALEESDNAFTGGDELPDTDDDYQEEWDMKKHKIINARNLAIALGILAAALIAVVFVLNNKINTLYNATVNLQQDLSDRCSVYEFSDSAGKVSGYLIKGSDGALTMIGGGGAENADALYDFLGDYGYEVENWYLYDTAPENTGAYLSCAYEKGVAVTNVYVLQRTQITGAEDQ